MKKHTGGFLIYAWWEASEGLNTDGAFDDWVECREDVEAYFQESGWNVVWTSNAEA
jgi:hypothetical protein